MNKLRSWSCSIDKQPHVIVIWLWFKELKVETLYGASEVSEDAVPTGLSSGNHWEPGWCRVEQSRVWSVSVSTFGNWKFRGPEGPVSSFKLPDFISSFHWASVNCQFLAGQPHAVNRCHSENKSQNHVRGAGGASQAASVIRFVSWYWPSSVIRRWRSHSFALTSRFLIVHCNCTVSVKHCKIL